MLNSNYTTLCFSLLTLDHPVISVDPSKIDHLRKWPLSATLTLNDVQITDFPQGTEISCEELLAVTDQNLGGMLIQQISIVDSTMDTDSTNSLLGCLMEHSYYEIYKVEFINWTGLDDKLSNEVFDQLENKIHDLTVLKFESMDSLNQIIKHDFAAKFL